MSRGWPVQDAVSAGGVVWKRSERGIEVALCGRIRENRWVLPKGTPDKGETMEQTALREVREETGLEVELGPRLGTITYWYAANGVRYHKQVHHWLMTPTGGDVSLHDHEFDEVEWLPIAEAQRRLTHPNERTILAEAGAAIDGAG